MLDYLYALVTNYYLVASVTAWLTAQILKIFTGVFKLQKFSLRAMFFGTGGMPSSHTATVGALAISVLLKEGPSSPLVAIAFVLAAIVTIDAVGVRRATGEHGKFLNMIIPELTKKVETMADVEVRFKELIGHTPLQVLVGAILGILIAVLMSFIPVFEVWA